MAGPSLYWQTFRLESTAESWEPLFVIARDQMREIGVGNATINQWDVSGTTFDTTVAATYIELGTPRWLAVAVAAGANAKKLNDALIAKFGAVHWP